MNFEWDATKNETNRVKHGIGFEGMAKFCWDFAICLDVQVVDFEDRELWVGPIKSGLFAVVIVEKTEGVTRIISLRPATNAEKAIWRKEFHHG